jgi:hypothetical protein
MVLWVLGLDRVPLLFLIVRALIWPWIIEG